MNGETLTHSTDFDAPAGQVERISPLIRRVVCGNGGPFTFTGTCSYIVGNGQVAIIDPGPDAPAHIDTVLAQLEGERVSHVVITHTHRDHSPAAVYLAEKTGAQVIGCAPFAPRPGPQSGLDSSHDTTYAPSRILADGDVLEGDGFTLEAIATPGHASNHMAYALREENALFSGDHVMAWSTSIVAPPDGSMSDYMASLDKLRERGETVYWPGHGGPVKDPPRYLRALAHHRRLRELAILNRVAAGDETIPAMVDRIYEGLDPRLKKAAALSVFAHLEDLVGRGAVKAEGKPAIDGLYRKAS